MNRNNIWIHVSIAMVLITIAAVIGQIDRWRAALKDVAPVNVTVEKKRMCHPAATTLRPEVLVRFKPGTGLDKIRDIAAGNHDRLVDEIESVSGLSVIDDLDDADAEAVASQYAALSDVEYAEPNFDIRVPIEPPASVSEHPNYQDLLYRSNDRVLELPEPLLPSDPRFSEQWALNNLGQDGGKARADIDALKAWLTTKGSEKVVVAVLDTGVDFTHVDLVHNMWVRPESVPAYRDDELGAFNDINGFDDTQAIPDPMDDNGHGTHCAGIIGAEGDNGEGIAGVNWKVKIMPLKFLGRGGFGSVDDAIEAIKLRDRPKGTWCQYSRHQRQLGFDHKVACA
jgi:hypothetical protein